MTAAKAISPDAHTGGGLRPLPARHAPAGRTRPKPIGQLLVDRGDLSAQDLARAVALQRREDARFGDILVTQGMVTSEALYDGLAEQYQTVVANLANEPPDVRLVDQLGADFCIRNGVLPWKRVGSATVVIFSRPETFERLAPRMPESFGRVLLAVAPDKDIHRALVATRHRALAGRAESRVEPDESCRSWNAGPVLRTAAAAAIALVATLLFAPALAFAVLAGWAIATLVVNSALKFAAALIYLRDRRPAAARQPGSVPGGPGFLRLPTVSLLVPLYRERAIAERLVKRLSALDYPRELLDICLIVEEDDLLTRETLSRSRLPAWMRQITVPAGAVRTKPRALNFALDFLRGSIVGVYDAEDAPEPGQIHKVVRRFADRGPEVACLQGVLDFYNPRENWLARVFTIEYASWFRVVLPGFARLGFAIPLGGTTLFFRRSALEMLGGWDAHNVTEDADLGIRLARYGFRTELIDTVTKEEANCRAIPWIKQRSRWIKGYAMTWLVHMRAPRQLLTDLGLRRFLGVQFLFLGTLSQFLLAPLLWSFWLMLFGLPHPLTPLLPQTAFIALTVIFLASELITIGVGVLAVAGGEHRTLWKWAPTMHVYWPLATFAAFKGVFEIITKPFYWDKTQHGHLHREQEIWTIRSARRPPPIQAEGGSQKPG